MQREEELNKEYKLFKINNILHKSRDLVLLILVVLSYFIYSDLFIRAVPIGSWIFLRLFPVSLCLIYITFSLTHISRNKMLMLWAYYFLLSSLMLMMLGITVRAYQTDLFSSSIFGIIIIIFTIFMLAKTGYKTLLILYVPPISIIAVYHIAFNIQVDLKELADFSNPAVILLGALILGHIQERMRFKEFQLKYSLNQEKNRSEELYRDVLVKTDSLQQANIDLKHKTYEIEAQRDEISSQRDLVVEQKNHIERQNIVFTDSITYAQKIQQAVLPRIDKFNHTLRGPKDQFVLYKPKDLVSGDFYWADQINGNIIIAVADCTGHGVPGAFLSMLGVSFLNEIINRQPEVKANQILNELRKYVKTTLNQTGARYEARDGMSIGLIILNTENYELQYSGAYIPLYLYRKGKCIVYKADRNPIGIHHKEIKTFSNHAIQLEPNDTLYLFTDGYVDQFNESGTEKFKYSRFKNLIGNISLMPMAKQKEILETNFSDWKGNHEQIDDVTILGIRV